MKSLLGKVDDKDQTTGRYRQLQGRADSRRPLFELNLPGGIDGPTPAPVMSGAGLSFLRERQKSLPRTGLAALSAHARTSRCSGRGWR